MERSISIGVAAAGDPSDPAAFSGVPSSLLRGLAAIGVDARPLPAALGSVTRPAVALMAIRGPRDVLSPRRAVGQRRADVLASPQMARLRSSALRLAVSRRQPDAVIQIGTEYRTPAGVPFVTYEDSTVVQAERAYEWGHLDVSERTLRSWIDRQRRCYERARACCAYNHWAAESIAEDYGQPRAKVAVVGVGINHRISPPPERSWWPPRFLFVGFDWKRKNGDRVVRAFTRLREQIPEAELHVAGGHPRLDVPGVSAHGRVPLDGAGERGQGPLVELFQSATCFVMPSLHEPTGIVHAEAGAAGIPSIGTSAGGPATLIGEGGRLVDPLSEEAILEAMIELSRPETAMRLGELALARARLMTWEKVAERLLRALRLPGPAGRPLAEFL